MSRKGRVGDKEARKKGKSERQRKLKEGGERKKEKEDEGREGKKKRRTDCIPGTGPKYRWNRTDGREDAGAPAAGCTLTARGKGAHLPPCEQGRGAAQ